MEFLVEVLRLVDASVSGDKKRVVAYARQLADKLERSGDVKAAKRIRTSIDRSSLASVGVAATSLAERVPVDGESRFTLADESRPDPNEINLYIEPQISSTVDEFVEIVRSSDRLVKEGVGIAPSMLLFGHPGCGKTELARLIAGRLEMPLITARADSLISSYLGSTSKNLRLLFEHAANRSCVLFLDEFDAVAKLRDDRHELGELKRVVVSLLQNIDAIHGNTVLIAATNHDHLLDPAIWRRFAYRVHVGLPSREARQWMFSTFLSRSAESKFVRKAAEASEGLSGSDIKNICDGARRESILRDADDVAEAEVLKRILFATVPDASASVEEIIREAKASYPQVYTLRVLADAFKMSHSNVAYQLRRAPKNPSSNKRQQNRGTK